jgi:RimJ/RimL family protein N-acetyltransferase
MSSSELNIPFAETSRLRLRSYRDTDLDKLIALVDDPRTQRTAFGYTVPKAHKLKDVFIKYLEGALLFIVIEAKEPVAIIQTHGDVTGSSHKSDWVGYMTLNTPEIVKNRDAEFAIALDAKFWGKGIGTSL